MIKVIDMKGQPEEPEKDFRAELAALINSNNADKPHPNLKILEAISSQLLKTTDELVQVRHKYLRLHNITDGKDANIPYDINAVQLGLTYAIHECHKIMSNLESELKKAKIN